MRRAVCSHSSLGLGVSYCLLISDSRQSVTVGLPSLHLVRKHYDLEPRLARLELLEEI